MTLQAHAGGTLTLIAAGDCGPVHGPKDGFPIERYTELVCPTLARADLRFANCERGVSFLPLLIDRQYRPEVLRGDDPRFDDMLRYMQWASEGFDAAFVRRGDEIAVTAAS